jgi:hypothetical protein
VACPCEDDTAMQSLLQRTSNRKEDASSSLALFPSNEPSG